MQQSSINKKSVSYHYVESVPNFCLENRDIIFTQLQACERLLKCTNDEAELSNHKKRDCRPASRIGCK